MHNFEDIKSGARLRGLDPAGVAEVEQFGPDALNLVFRVDGRNSERLVYRDEESGFEFLEAGSTGKCTPASPSDSYSDDPGAGKTVMAGLLIKELLIVAIRSAALCRARRDAIRPSPLRRLDRWPYPQDAILVRRGTAALCDLILKQSAPCP
jgi:hypothetical protein